jgi:CRP/FNR family transcriptional regulator
MKKTERHVASCLFTVPIFSTLDDDEKIEVALIANHKKIAKGESVYLEGNKDNTMYVVHEGKIKVSRYSESGKEQVIRILGEGEFLGELTLFTSQATTDFAFALEPSVVCMIEARQIKAMMEKHPSIALKVLEELSKRLNKVESLVEEISLLSVEKRLAQYLLSNVNEFNEVELPISKGDFASSLGMSQETLSRKLALFQEKKYIKLEGQRKIVLLSKDDLKIVE